MDIGNHIRCYTVEPLHDPVRRPRAVPEQQEPVFDPALGFDHGLYEGDLALHALLSPGHLRRTVR